MFSSSNELCLIDSGITDLSKLPIREHLRVINLHANHLERIENFSKACFLVHLDLSSNRIRTIENLSPLVRLKTLNLSCNCIQQVSGLGGLHSLVKLDLSYNSISKVDDFLELHGPQYQLRCVKLHGNQISSAAELSGSLSGCQSLQALTVSIGSTAGSNPMCKDPRYVTNFFTHLPQLAVLDGHDHQGRSVESDSDVADLSGLEEYDELLRPADSVPQAAVTTPKVDAALNAYHRGKTVTSSTQSDLDSAAASSAAEKTVHTENHEDRLRLLEQQLSDLMKRREAQKHDCLVQKSSSDDSVVHTTKPDTDKSDDSGNDRVPTRASARTATTSTQNSGAKSRSGTNARRPLKRTTHMSDRSGPTRPNAEHPGAKFVEASDRRMRDDLRATYVNLVRELESERERRAAGELATKRVVDQLEDAMKKAAEDNEAQQTAIDAAVRIKRVLVAEKESHQKTRALVEVLREKLDQLQKTIDERDKAAEEARETAKLNNDTAGRVEQEHLRRIAELTRQAQEFQLSAAATARELELVKAETSSTKEQVRQLQMLLADREKSHQQEISGKHPLNSQAVDDLVAKALAKAERDRLRVEHAQTKKYDELAKKYSELEDEFRMALQVEMERFKELQVAFEQTSSEAAVNKAALEVARQKDEKSVATISELMSFVREQKARLTELSRAKSERSAEQRERVQQLEAHLDEARRRMIQFEMLKKEHTKVQAALQAQESLVAGLREERKVWSDELAQQGTSLAQDRGRLEARIEALQSELSEARKRTERDVDALRIKSKVVDDQTETIRKLKDAVVERDEQIKDSRAEHVRAQREIESQLATESAENQLLSEQLSRERSRRDELKTLVSDLQSRLADEQHAHSVLQDRWREKTDTIAAVERQVQQMKSTWDGKEQKLLEERDKAVAAGTAAATKLRDVDDAFRRQLDTVETGHRAAIAQVSAAKQAEVEAAMKRASEVEDEMRVLLLETDATRQNTEARIRKLTSAFTDLQQDLVR